MLEALAEVLDPRSRHGRRDSIQSILGMAVCAMAYGARSIAAISQWGKAHRELARAALGLTREQTPHGTTVHRLFRKLEVEAFEKVLGKWLRGLHGEKAPGVDLVAAYAHQRGVVLDQRSVEGEGQELKAAKRLLKRLRLEGRVVTGDALLAQQRICRDIVGKGGHYLFRLKGNQPSLQAAVALLFAEPPSVPARVRQRHRRRDRQEERGLAISSELDEWAQWPLLGQVGQVWYTCERRGKISCETSHFITSLFCAPGFARGSAAAGARALEDREPAALGMRYHLR